MNRSCFYRYLAGIIVLALLAAVTPTALAADAPPIKIGLMVPFVGVFAQDGKEIDKGFRMGLDEIGNKVAGRPIVIAFEDTETKPELGPTKARKLIENEKVHMLAGFNHSGVALSVREIVVSNKIPMIITNAGAADLTGKQKSPYIFRTSFSNGQHDLVAGWYAYHKLGYRHVIVLTADFTAGYEKAAGFMKTFKAAGGQIVDEIYAPLNTTDFSPYLTKIATRGRSGVDAVWVFFPGVGSIRLVNQYAEFGLKNSIPMFAIGDSMDETALQSMKDSALGVRNYLHYAESLNTPENQKFVKAYMAKYKEHPTVYSAQGYLGAKVIAAALEAVKGKVEDKEAFMAALRKVRLTSPQGLFSFDADQNAVINVYIREVRKINGRYTHVVLESIPNVDQNWSPAKLVANKK